MLHTLHEMHHFNLTSWQEINLCPGSVLPIGFVWAVRKWFDAEPWFTHCAPIMVLGPPICVWGPEYIPEGSRAVVGWRISPHILMRSKLGAGWDGWGGVSCCVPRLSSSLFPPSNAAFASTWVHHCGASETSILARETQKLFEMLEICFDKGWKFSVRWWFGFIPVFYLFTWFWLLFI